MATALTIFIIGVIMIIGFILQAFLILKIIDSREPEISLMAVILPMILGIATIIGIPFYKFFQMVTNSAVNIGFGCIMYAIFRTSIFTLMLIIKSLLPVLTFAFSLSIFTYFLLIHNDPNTFPVISQLLKWIFSETNKIMEWSYFILMGGYSFLCIGIQFGSACKS